MSFNPLNYWKERRKKKAEEKQQQAALHGHKGNFRELAEVALYGLLLLMFFRVYVFQNFKIPTSSMENTLLIGDHITANTFIFNNSTVLEKKLLPHRDVQRGDVVVFKWPGDERQDWIKRCIGVPGDEFSINLHVPSINGKPLHETYPFFKKHRGLFIHSDFSVERDEGGKSHRWAFR